MPGLSRARRGPSSERGRREWKAGGGGGRGPGEGSAPGGGGRGVRGPRGRCGLELGGRSGRRRGGGPGGAGGVPRGRSAAPARRPLPDSRPPRVHSDFSAHFSSSPVTPALALPPPAAPPRSASRGNPATATAAPGVQPALRRRPRSHPACPLSPHVFQARDPQICPHGTDCPGRGQALGRALGPDLALLGPAQTPLKKAANTHKTGMRAPTLLRNPQVTVNWPLP